VRPSFLQAALRQAATLDQTAHRPWPLPHESWIQGQTWRSLLFAHWRVDEAALRPFVPRALELDVRDGSAWMAVTPFVLTDLRIRGAPPVPRLSTFPELNVRTYVTHHQKPGIFFFSLDAGSRLMVAGARRFYRLPYYFARMEVNRSAGRVHYTSERRDSRGPDARFSGSVEPSGKAREAEPGSLTEFLIERYCLYTVDGEGRPLRGDIHHPPWRLRDARAEIELMSVMPPGLDLPDDQPLLHFSDRQDVLAWKLRPALP
jgi:uncharacterized protein